MFLNMLIHLKNVFFIVLLRSFIALRHFLMNISQKGSFIIMFSSDIFLV